MTVSLASVLMSVVPTSSRSGNTTSNFVMPRSASPSIDSSVNAVPASSSTSPVSSSTMSTTLTAPSISPADTGTHSILAVSFDRTPLG